MQVNCFLNAGCTAAHVLCVPLLQYTARVKTEDSNKQNDRMSIAAWSSKLSNVAEEGIISAGTPRHRLVQDWGERPVPHVL
jgi:hypothetical protein